jgi:hypothetical protein
MANAKAASNFSIYQSESGMGDLSLSCELDGARYHVWVDRVTHEVRPTLYKNSLAKPTEPEYFNTRQLSVTSKFSTELITLMLSYADTLNLWAKADEELKAKQAKAKAELAERIRYNRIKNAAIELYDALTALGSMPDGYCFCQPEKRDASKPEADHTGECRDARAALILAETGGAIEL